MTNKTTPALPASEWRARLAAPDAVRALEFDTIYGGDPTLCDARRRRLAALIARYEALFGDEPVRIFRAPGRINLRGMHVDTHGGWLNLMTHQREILVAAAPSPDADTHVVNTDPARARLTIRRAELPVPEPGESWADFLARPDTHVRVAAAPGHWRHYLEGAWIRARHAFPNQDIGGLNMVVDSDLPQGAALSSSASLCVALLHAWLGWYDAALDNDGLILAAQDAEWYTGSRCGTCDQAAIVLGRPNAVVHAALDPRAFTSAGARSIAFPEALRVLVINSYTTRSISGGQKAAYTTNRFGYSMALAIFQQALRDCGYPEDVACGCDALSRITPELLGGGPALYRVLQQVPEALPLDELRQRFDLPGLDAEYDRYFSDLPPALRPKTIALRGPLLFGIAESERARLFAAALEGGEYTRAGQLMTAGHDGDRVVGRDGHPFHRRADDAYLEQLAVCDTPIALCPGVYGASSPALDALVDAALDHGALGASLTGAGIAGSVLALCRAEDAERIAAGIRETMGRTAYPATAGLPGPLNAAEFDGAVVMNRATQGAGEITCAGAGHD